MKKEPITDIKLHYYSSQNNGVRVNWREGDYRYHTVWNFKDGINAINVIYKSYAGAENRPKTYRTTLSAHSVNGERRLKRVLGLIAVHGLYQDYLKAEAERLAEQKRKLREGERQEALRMLGPDMAGVLMSMKSEIRRPLVDPASGVNKLRVDDLQLQILRSFILRIDNINAQARAD